MITEVFIDNKASVETCWRSIVLLGRNTASYKFALAKSLLETSTESSLVSVPANLSLSVDVGSNDNSYYLI